MVVQSCGSILSTGVPIVTLNFTKIQLVALKLLRACNANQMRNQLILHVAGHDRNSPIPSTSSGARPKETPRRSSRVKQGTRAETETVSARSKTKNVVNKTSKKQRTTPPLVDITEDDEDNVPTPLNSSVLSEDTCLRAIEEMRMKLSDDLGNKLSEAQRHIVSQVTRNLQGELRQRWIEEENRELQRQEVRDILSHFREKERLKKQNAQPEDSETSPRLVRRGKETIVITHHQPKDPGTHEKETKKESEVQPKVPRAGLVKETCDGECDHVPESPVQESETGEEESEVYESEVYTSKSEDLPQHVGAVSTDESEEE